MICGNNFDNVELTLKFDLYHLNYALSPLFYVCCGDYIIQNNKIYWDSNADFRRNVHVDVIGFN